MPGLNDIEIIDVAIGSNHAGPLSVAKKKPRTSNFDAVLLNREGSVYTWGLSKCDNIEVLKRVLGHIFVNRYGCLGIGEGVVEAAAPRKAGCWMMNDVVRCEV